MPQKALQELAPEALDAFTHAVSLRECPGLSSLKLLPAAVSFKVWKGDVRERGA